MVKNNGLIIFWFSRDNWCDTHLSSSTHSNNWRISIDQSIIAVVLQVGLEPIPVSTEHKANPPWWDATPSQSTQSRIVGNSETSILLLRAFGVWKECRENMQIPHTHHHHNIQRMYYTSDVNLFYC